MVARIWNESSVYRNRQFQYKIGDLVEIYSPLSQHHGYYALVIAGPNVYGVYTVLIQSGMIKRNFAFGELERIN